MKIMLISRQAHKRLYYSSRIYSHKGGYVYKGEISRVLKGLGFTEDDFYKFKRL